MRFAVAGLFWRLIQGCSGLTCLLFGRFKMIDRAISLRGANVYKELPRERHVTRTQTGSLDENVDTLLSFVLSAYKAVLIGGREVVFATILM